MVAMRQIPLPLAAQSSGPARIVIGAANEHVVEALAEPETWPYRTAVMTGPARAGKTLLARWFAESGKGAILDDAHLMAEDDLFHRWNRAQEEKTALLIVAGSPPWNIALPDLRSRLGAALQLEIRQPDDEMARDLLLSMAEEKGLPLSPEAANYLVPRAPRSQADLARLVEMIDLLSLERKAPATQSIWRAALEAVYGPDEPRLI